MSPEQLLNDFENDFTTRKFAAGMLLAFIDFLRELSVFGRGYPDFGAFLADFPLVERWPDGRQRNTLFVEVATEKDGPPRVVGIRPAYNRAEAFFRQKHWRLDYPNCAPHATGQWRDFRPWLNALVSFSGAEVDAVEAAVKRRVLTALPSHRIDPALIKPPARPFTRILEDFDFTRQTHEPRGTPFQGVIYAYIRADAPHLHLQTSKVGSGSRRQNRYGDIDGWDGARLVLSVEVKHYDIDDAHLGDVTPFLGTVAPLNAMPIIAATGFSDLARARIAEFGGRMLDLESLVALVDLWDPLKQQAALQGFVYFVHRVQQNTPLIRRLTAFLEQTVADDEARRPDAPPPELGSGSTPST